MGLFFLIPISFLLLRGIDFGQDFLDSFADTKALAALRKTLWLALTVTLSASVLGIAVAWFTARTDMAGRRWMGIVAVLPLAFPSYVGAVALIAGFSRGGLAEKALEVVGIHNLPNIHGFGGAWIALTLFTYPFVYLPVRARLINISKTQEESARLLGRGPGVIFFTVILPQAARAVSTGALLVFLYTISDFGAVALLRYNTLTRSIFFNRLANQPAAAGQAALLVLVALIVVAAERYISRRQTQASSQALGPPLLVPLKKWRWPVSLATGAMLFIALVGPVVVMLYWIGRGIANRGRVSGSLAISLDGLIEPIFNTIFLGIITGLAAMVIVFPVARLVSRYRSRLATGTSAVVSASFGFPGIVIALGMAYWALSGPGSSTYSSWIYQTLPLMIAAYLLHFGAQAIGNAEVAISALPNAMEESAQTLGAGRTRRFLGIELPLMAPGLAAGIGLVMLSTMKELPITLLLSPTDFSTLATHIWGSMEELALAQAGLVSLILIGLSGVLGWIFIFGGDLTLGRNPFKAAEPFKRGDTNTSGHQISQEISGGYRSR